MTTQQKTIEYQGGRLTRLNNLPITQLVGGMIMMKYRNCPCHLSPQILHYLNGWHYENGRIMRQKNIVISADAFQSELDGWHDQDVELSLEVS